jgi:diguanylate cyclase (GGDEF)-like protein
MEFKYKLSTKIIFTIVFAVVISVGINGIYFDSFIKERFFHDVKQKTISAKNRVVTDILKLENALKKGIGFVHDDETLIASISLINNYQDKDNYNIYLLDEEKKYIANRLYEKVKNSLNNSIVLYDKNDELMAYVVQDSKGYKLNFISYEEGKAVIYSKYESENEFTKERYHENRYTSLKHMLFYSPEDLKEHRDLLTYHFAKDSSMVITSHQSLFDEYEKSRTLAHIEMSKLLDSSYFQNISSEINLDIYLSNSEQYMRDSLPFSRYAEFKERDIYQDKNSYYSILSIQTHSTPIYLVFKLDKSAFNKTLTENRLQTVAVSIVIILFMLVVLQLLMRRYLVAPLNNLMEQIFKVQEKDYSLTKIIRTGDEIEEISISINKLASTVSKREIALRESQKRLRYLSTHDELTDLLNRRSFTEEFEDALHRVEKRERTLAVIFLDLDEFKQINDTLGHIIGDFLLIAVSKRLEQVLPKRGVLARVGGDEFNIFIENYRDVAEIADFAQKLLDLFKKPFLIGDNEISSSTSIGIALFPKDGKDTITLTKNSDLAMYMAKDGGRNSYQFYSKELSDKLEKRTKIITALKMAIEHGDEFTLFYQPKVSIETKKVVAVEALIRWNSPTLGFVSPFEFIGIAEETHLIIPIGEWVLKQAIEDFILLKENGFYLEQMSVNVSNIQLQYGNIVHRVKELIDKSEIEPEELELEITESYIASNEKEAIAMLQSFRDMSVELAIDDFGTGYSSLGYLQKLPVTRLKVDKSFVDEIPHSSQSVAVAKAIIALAETFNLKVTVEGVEYIEQLQFFEGKYCHDIQGYIFSKPLPIDQLKEFMQKFREGGEISM